MESLYFTARPGEAPSTTPVRGTAWLLQPDVVVTALHVAGTLGDLGSWVHERWFRGEPKDAGQAYELRAPGGAFVRATPIAYDAEADVALLALPKGSGIDDDAFAVLAPEAVEIGEPWHAVGYPAFETIPRAIAVGGAVAFVGEGIANNTMQLRVDQGTSVSWAGISGSAAQNAWGEAIGLVLQTVANTATCNGAPAEAVVRLLRFRAHMPAITAAIADRLRGLGDDAIDDLLSDTWSWLPSTDAYKRDPIPAFADRIAQAGPSGVRAVLAKIRTLAAPHGKTAPDAGADPILADLERAISLRPSEDDLSAVLRALVDAGGDVAAGRDLAARLPDMPSSVLEAALEALRVKQLRAGKQGLSGAASITEAGARRAVSPAFLRAVLRAVAAGDLPQSEVAGRIGIGPEALRRTLVCADRLRVVARQSVAGRPGDPMLHLTNSGRSWLDLRFGDPLPRGDGSAR